MFNRIVVGHDHLAGGQDALALARVIAKATGDELILAGIIPVGLMPTDVEVVWRAEEHEFAENIRSRASDADGEARVFHSHSVARGLSDLAEEVGAGLIVVGASRRGKPGRILAGNIALQVLHGAHCAVGVAPVGYAEHGRDSLDSLVVGVDGAPEAQAAAAVAAGLAAASGAQTTLVSVVQEPPPAYGKGGGAAGIGELKSALGEHLRSDLERAAGAFAGDGKPETKLVEGEPVASLCAAAEDASLLIVGSRGYGPLGRVVLGSTDAELLNSAPSPMLVWPRRAEVPSSSESAQHVPAGHGSR